MYCSIQCTVTTTEYINTQPSFKARMSTYNPMIRMAP